MGTFGADYSGDQGQVASSDFNQYGVALSDGPKKGSSPGPPPPTRAIVRGTSAVGYPTTTTETTPALNVPSGDSIYVWVFWGTLSGQSVSSIVDSAGNSYSLVGSIAGTNQKLSLYTADNVTGSATLTVTVQFSGSTLGDVLVADVGKAAEPGSLDVTGAGSAGAPYVSDTVESDDVTPSSAYDLLLLALAVQAKVTSGQATITFNTPAGSTLEDSVTAIANGSGTSTRGLALYSKPASGLGAQSAEGSATLGGTGVGSNAGWIAWSAGVNPS